MMMKGLMNIDIKRQPEMAKMELREKGPWVQTEVKTEEKAFKLLAIGLEKEWKWKKCFPFFL